jgi:hypothetical protein
MEEGETAETGSRWGEAENNTHKLNTGHKKIQRARTRTHHEAGK